MLKKKTRRRRNHKVQKRGKNQETKWAAVGLQKNTGRISIGKKMDHIAAVEQQMVSERLRRKLDEVNSAAQTHLSPVQDHINFTLQQAYFKCAYECFDRERKQEQIGHCVENCSVPVVNAQHQFENEMAKFQERLNRSLMVCQDKFEASKLQQIGSDALNALELCVDQSIQDTIKTLPHLVGRLKVSLSIRD